MGELIERIARALCAEAGVDPDARVWFGAPLHLDPVWWAPVGPGRPAWHTRLRDARAMLVCLDDSPTKAMIDAAWVEQAIPIAVAQGVWRAMIQAELKE